MVRIIILTLLLAISSRLLAEPIDPYDSQDSLASQFESNRGDETKSIDTLLEEASELFQDERPLDGRSKLLAVLKKDPKEFRAHLLLAGYYMDEVGHFRLALRYVKQAQALFKEKYGEPPYDDYLVKSQHDHLLYLLSQARLNLDDYQGALQALDEYSTYGYMRDWYPASRAWILMKLGRVEEAIKVARLGLIIGAEPGRTLNMLGILLSMHNEKSDALKIFQQGIEYEFSLGKLGRPATPLNNSGEVYNELFRENLAESSWVKAVKLPDGCEHVLPSLNLTLLYIEQNQLAKAKHAIDDFESCIAQYPLRNGEEHKALVHLARGRIALHSGEIDDAIVHLEAALEKQQWFGKIGTNLDDLRAGAQISLAQALRARSYQLSTTLSKSWIEALDNLRKQKLTELRSWWFFRRARQVLVEDLNNLEDLYVRNTDSLIEYSSFGDALQAFPPRDLDSRIKQIKEHDTRHEPDSYYKIYRAQALEDDGQTETSLELLKQTLPTLRSQLDESLQIRAQLLQLKSFKELEDGYSFISENIFEERPAALRNYGFKLVVNFAETSESELSHKLHESNFIVDNAKAHTFKISAVREANEFTLRLTSETKPYHNISVKSQNLEDAINMLAHQVFHEDLR